MAFLNQVLSSILQDYIVCNIYISIFIFVYSLDMYICIYIQIYVHIYSLHLFVIPNAQFMGSGRQVDLGQERGPGTQ